MALDLNAIHVAPVENNNAFLKDHFPSLFLDYVAERESYGLTRFQTNCPSLKLALKNLNKSSAASPISIDSQYTSRQVLRP